MKSEENKRFTRIETDASLSDSQETSPKKRRFAILETEGWNPSEEMTNPKEPKKETAVSKKISREISAMLAGWRDFYVNKLGFDADFVAAEFSKLIIPERKDGFDRLLVIPKGLTINQAFALCRNKFSVWSYSDNLDESVTKNDRTAGKSYAIWVRDRKEADKELKNLSADDLEEKGIKGITLLERLVYELKYFDETGEHLDINNITLCSGSRYSDGDVPHVSWGGGTLGVGWCDSDGARGDLRARVAVS